MTIRRTLFATASLGAILLAASAASQPLPGASAQPDAAQVISQRVASARTAGITDLDAHSPVEALAQCSAKAAPAPETRAAVPAALAAAFRAAQSYSDAQKGKGLLVMVDGVIVHESYAQGLDASSQFVSQSLHKSLLALVVLAAVEDGLIGSLDDPLGSYVPQWADDPRGRISLRQAMQMASALELFSMAGGDSRALAMNFGPDLEAAALASPLVGQPGSAFAYNNANAQLVGTALANALQRASRGRYATYLAERIWCPLGNGSAALRLDRAGGSPQYFAGVHASLRDWARIGEALRTAKIGSRPAPGNLDQIFVPSAPNPNYGLFTWLGSPADGKRRYSPGNPIFIPHSAPYRARDMAFMDGFGGQRVYVSRDARLVIARFGDISFTYDDAIIPNLVTDGLIAAGEVTLP